MPTPTKPAANGAAGPAPVSPGDLLIQARDLQAAMFHQIIRRAGRRVMRALVMPFGTSDTARLRSAGSRAH